ncbi:MAG TPA: DUF86 domain-containing protein [Dongiaceae bacterium]|nr:DUF86 domain-containing protein [Dongiaceae bacterium]
MGKHNPYQSLADILENIERAQRYLGTSSLRDFRTDEEKVDAILRRLQNASEASTRFRNEWPERAAAFEDRHSEVNWANFRNLGNRYRHDYDNIDVERIYEDLQTLIPQVQRAVSAELPFSEPGEQTEIQ